MQGLDEAGLPVDEADPSLVPTPADPLAPDPEEPDEPHQLTIRQVSSNFRIAEC